MKYFYQYLMKRNRKTALIIMSYSGPVVFNVMFARQLKFSGSANFYSNLLWEGK